MGENNLKKLINQPYKYGFATKIEKEEFPTGLNEDIIKLISKKKMNQVLCRNFD